MRSLSANLPFGSTDTGFYYDAGGPVAGLVLFCFYYFVNTARLKAAFASSKMLGTAIALMIVAFFACALLPLPFAITYFIYSVGFHAMRIYSWVYIIDAFHAHGLSPIKGTAITQALIALSVTFMVFRGSSTLVSMTMNVDDLARFSAWILFATLLMAFSISSSADLETVWGMAACTLEKPKGQNVLSDCDDADKMKEVSSSSADIRKRLYEHFGLTSRETEVAQLLAEGRSMPYIRDSLIISIGTVNTHRAHIYQKMNVHNRQEFLDVINGNS